MTGRVSVLSISAEMAPLAKVGGLGGISGSLPRALRRLGFDVRVPLPCYDAVKPQELLRSASLAFRPAGKGR